MRPTRGAISRKEHLQGNSSWEYSEEWNRMQKEYLAGCTAPRLQKSYAATVRYSATHLRHNGCSAMLLSPCLFPPFSSEDKDSSPLPRTTRSALSSAVSELCSDSNIPTRPSTRGSAGKWATRLCELFAGAQKCFPSRPERRCMVRIHAALKMVAPIEAGPP